MTVEQWQRIEGGVIAAITLMIAFTAGTGWSWWLWPVLLLAPDLSILGYLAGPRWGAWIYNLFHLYAFGMALVLLGLTQSSVDLITFGLVWLGHVGIDRALGLGLKEPSGFGDTHLGRISRRK